MEEKKSPGLTEGQNDRERTKGGVCKSMGQFMAAEEGAIKQGAKILGFNWVRLFPPHWVAGRIK